MRRKIVITLLEVGPDNWSWEVESGNFLYGGIHTEKYFFTRQTALETASEKAYDLMAYYSLVGK